MRGLWEVHPRGATVDMQVSVCGGQGGAAAGDAVDVACEVDGKRHPGAHNGQVLV